MTTATAKRIASKYNLTFYYDRSLRVWCLYDDARAAEIGVEDSGGGYYSPGHLSCLTAEQWEEWCAEAAGE